VTVTVLTVENPDRCAVHHGLDTAFVREVKATLWQASEELGQLTQKYEIGVTRSGQHPAKRRSRFPAVSASMCELSVSPLRPDSRPLRHSADRVLLSELGKLF
jgi:hypothetical protein